MSAGLSSEILKNVNEVRHLCAPPWRTMVGGATASLNDTAKGLTTAVLEAAGKTTVWRDCAGMDPREDSTYSLSEGLHVRHMFLSIHWTGI
ncbi:hypothetical protein FQA47_017269 [Oryzias melastigma]|uniref:Uncharacterized protein n=1 Tax=Oryzias melastigma TaxID=30732 RepID=A0A834FL51_ORYME|nr:hypothetical protein FQA47_017269 [Oryzias melastigma]